MIELLEIDGKEIAVDVDARRENAQRREQIIRLERKIERLLDFQRLACDMHNKLKPYQVT